MRILDKELEMSVRMHVNNDGGIVDNVMVQIFKVLFVIPHYLNSFLYLALL